jgi:hypothetical protein
MSESTTLIEKGTTNVKCGSMTMFLKQSTTCNGETVLFNLMDTTSTSDLIPTDGTKCGLGNLQISRMNTDLLPEHRSDMELTTRMPTLLPIKRMARDGRSGTSSMLKTCQRSQPRVS